MSTVGFAQYGEGRRTADDGGQDLVVEGLQCGRATRPTTERAKDAAGRRPGWVRRHRELGLDVGAVLIAALDVALRVIPDTQPYNWVLSIVAVLALVVRRRFPFLVVLLTIPGFLAGWAQLAAMIALGSLARRKLLGWQTLVAAALVWLSRFLWWPPSQFLAQEWRTHVHDAIYGCIVAGMPIAIGLLAHARQQLSQRIGELAASRERERGLHARAVRADERARLAREMHDVVSHQVSLIAVQAGALRMSVADAEAKQVAATIRTLSTRTLDELRQLVSVLRTTGDDSPQPRLDEVPQLVAGSGVAATLTIRGEWRELPAPISGAAYRTVQEALTNIRKHAAASPASVVVDVEEDVLRVEVHNERSGAPSTPLPGGGHGLVGLRERAALLGGRFEAGPTDEGGFLLRVTFPLVRPRDEQAETRAARYE
jgi:signal transduction histidine kinase